MAQTASSKLGLAALLSLALVGCGPEPVPAVAAPSFSFEDTRPDRAEISNATLKGKVAILDFWATWCGPCRETMPTLQAIHEQYQPKGLMVIGVNDEVVSLQRRFADSKGYTYTFALDRHGSGQGRFDVYAIPHLVLLNKKGEIIFQHSGGGINTEALSRKIEAALAE